MYQKLQLTNLILLGIYALLLTAFTLQLPGMGIMLIAVITCIVFWAYFILAAFVFFKKTLLTAAWLQLIRFNVYLNLFFLLGYFIVLPCMIVLVSIFPALAFLGLFLNQFGPLFFIGLLILLAANFGCFIWFAKKFWTG